MMATASLSVLLRRAASFRPSFVNSASRSSSAARLPPASSHPSHRRSITSCLAFHDNGPFRRPVGIAFSNNGSASSRSFSAATHLESTSSPVVETDPAKSRDVKKPIPTILLAGFLGSGKTSTLKHLLENNSDIRIGTIVNDVASVNIDAKLIANLGSQNNGDAADDGVVELQNGCACCSLADELLDSVEKLTRGRDLDAIVVELSGVADPMAVRDNWAQAQARGHPATRLATLSRTVTLVDACTFGTDWMTWDTAGDRSSWAESGDDCAAARRVPELLAEQVEAADLLLVNKVDLAGKEQAGVASSVARGLNAKASVMEVEFGRVGARELLGELLGEEGEDAPEAEAKKCEEPDCTDTSHSHDHSSSECDDADCTDASHSHGHSPSECDDADCTDTSHSHDHSSSECEDSDCTDTSHSHDHSHEPKSATAADQLGITSFVYASSTPFNSQRLLALLNRWPVPIKDSLEFLGQEGGTVGDVLTDEHRAFTGVLRSKGFCWMAPGRWSDDAWRHDTAMYWSHAGKHFGITSAGKWWGTLTKETMKPYFAGNEGEYDRILREDWVSEEWCDRRQELVFIGANFDEGEIREALDGCLCSEEEMDDYRAQLRNHLETTVTTTAKGGP